MKLFAQLRKVDEEKRLIYARAAQEVVDKSGEIMDYESSVPHFKKWSEEVAKDTDGKSLGNVRAMHGKVAAGKLTGIDFNDTEKAVDVVVKVVDDGEWKKVLEGVYTGLSIGGNYVGEPTVEKVDGQDVKRYTAAPNEVSLVDRPCIPTAKFFEVQKADGTLAKVDFQAPAAPEDGDLIVNGTADEVAQLAKLMNEQGFTMAQVLAKVAAREDVDAADKKRAKEKYGDVEYADEKNKKYPLDTPEHVRAAASYFGQEKNRSKYDAEDQKAIDAKIAAAKKKHGIGEGDDEKKKSEKALEPRELRKGLYTCGSLASVLGEIEYICRSVCYEAEVEGDGSDLGQRLLQWLADGGAILQDMVAEETEEATAGKDADEVAAMPVMAMAERVGALHKALQADLKKVGARNSKADQDRIQKMHDHSVELGAQCGAAKAAGGDLAKMAPGGDLQKFVADAVTAAVEPLNKALTAANEKITKLEAQPAPTQLRLRVVSKADDVGTQAAQPAVTPVTDASGKEMPVASLIKSLHQSGGAPLVAPLSK